MSDEYLEVVAWFQTRNGKKLARNLGYAKRVGDKIYLTLQCMPAPQEGTFQLVVQPQRQQQGSGGGGGGGGGGYAKPRETNPGQAQDVDDMPF